MSEHIHRWEDSCTTACPAFRRPANAALDAYGAYLAAILPAADTPTI